MSRVFEALYPQRPGYKEETTSKEAADFMAPAALPLRERCLNAIAQRPSTPDEIASTLGETVLAIRPRITELSKMGMIEDTGERRKNASGRRAKVWRYRHTT